MHRYGGAERSVVLSLPARTRGSAACWRDTELTFWHSGRNFRLMDAGGRVVKDSLVSWIPQANASYALAT